ncbi:MAG: hypothetical protein B7Z03_01800 [Hydrogenophilales bacterium 32-62-9]|nr:MAG: hypothetical protein B7Z03_01800 [Hydrogenophilales bacterium 32-62-9]
MEVIMPTARSLQVKNPQLNAQGSAGGPGAGSIDLAMLTLDDQGVILECGTTCESMFGYPSRALLGSPVSRLIPQLSAIELVEDERINSRLAHLCHCAIAFEARRRDGETFKSELFINRLGRHNVAVLVRKLASAPSGRRIVSQ